MNRPAPLPYVAAVVLFTAATTVGARVGAPLAAAPDQAAAIVAESQRRTDSTSHRYEGLLRSFDQKGKTSEKRWIYERVGAHGDSKVVIRFTAPAEVKGVALLIANHRDRASDQWMWTPALERDRRIALQDRSTRFFGTDFTFEDLEERDVDQFDYALESDEMVAGVSCWTIRSTPKPGKRSQYTRSTWWIRKSDYALLRSEMWNGNDLLRRLDYQEIRSVQGILTAHDMTMADLGRGTKTQLLIERVQYNLPLRDADFTVEALRR